MHLKRFVILLLVSALLFGCRSVVIADSEPVNSILWRRETEITPDIRMVETVLDNGSRQAEHYICYRPGGAAMPSLAYGESILEKLKFPDAADLSEDRVLAGINGDYFVMATGMPLGLVIHEGELISSDAGNAAFGFYEDGSAILGMPELQIELEGDGILCTIFGVNKNLKSGQFCLYTSAWGDSITPPDKCRYIELLPEEACRLAVGGELGCTVNALAATESAIPLKEGTLVLCFCGSEYVWQDAGLSMLETGAKLKLTVHASDPRFERCSEALGCLYPLVTEGAVRENLDDIDKNKAPRTAIGIKEDGTVVFYTADGRQPGYAVGLTLSEMAERLLQLGCVEAGAMDGGASTVIACQLPGEEVCGVRNAPSLGKLRETPQFLLLTAPYAESGELGTIGVYCEERILLAGSSCQISCGGCDMNGAPVELQGCIWSVDEGRIDQEGVLTAPDQPGEVTVTVRCGDVRGTIQIPVIEQPDTIRLFHEENDAEILQLQVLPCSETKLSARAFWNRLPVCAADTLFDWSTEGDIGNVDEEGTFTASETAGPGFLIVRCGDTEYKVRVLVTDTVNCLDGFENAAAGSLNGLSWTPEKNRDKVKYGFGSLRLDYDLSGGSVDYPMNDYPTELGGKIGFWLLSDGSGNSIYSVHDEITLLLGRMDYPGWMQFTVNVGLFGQIRSLRLGGSGSGTLWMDQLLAFNFDEPDLEAPVIQLEEDGNRLNALIWDRVEGILDSASLKITIDGAECPFYYDHGLGTVTMELPSADRSVHIVLTAADRSGNYNSASLLTGNGAASGFPDMTGHWAESYVNYLRGIGVLSGRPAADGSLYFDPNSRITRAEFAVMVCRWLKLDTPAVDDMPSFADDAAIPSWAADSVKAVAALGLIQGSAAEDGLYFLPKEPLTRSQAAVILGRTMPGGRMQSDLPWPDAGDIPAWARTYVSELAFMGVMTGNGETFEPNASLTRAQAAKLLAALT